MKCDRHRDSWMAPRINLVGQRFGYLAVTKQVEPQLYQWRKRRAPLRVPQYEVKCDCGTVKITKAKLLRNGSVKSCGCRRYPVRTCPKKRPQSEKGLRPINNHIGECAESGSAHPTI